MDTCARNRYRSIRRCGSWIGFWHPEDEASLKLVQELVDSSYENFVSHWRAVNARRCGREAGAVAGCGRGALEGAKGHAGGASTRAW